MSSFRWNNFLEMPFFIFPLSLIFMKSYLLYMGEYSVAFTNKDFSIDTVSILFIMLTSWITLLIFLTSQNLFLGLQGSNSLNMMIGTLYIILLLTFTVNSTLSFYFMFEATVVPTFFIILGWGYQPERVQAGMYLLLYTLFGSVPLLIILLKLDNLVMSSFFFDSSVYIGDLLPAISYLMLITAFLMKLPMYLLHLWLPKAHVEAPLVGSMVLAAILLKLSGYAFIRTMGFLPFLEMATKPVWIFIGLLSGVLVGILCLIQVDMKALIAYSSVAHMGIMLASLLTFNQWGLKGGLIIMVAHGLTSSALFFLASLLYDMTKSRSLMVNTGFMSYLPSMSIWWFLLSITSMSAPPSLNFMGEVGVMFSLMGWSESSLLLLFLSSLLSGAYNLYLYSETQHGVSTTKYTVMATGMKSHLILFLHWAPLNTLSLFMGVSLMEL